MNTMKYQQFTGCGLSTPFHTACLLACNQMSQVGLLQMPLSWGFGLLSLTDDFTWLFYVVLEAESALCCHAGDWNYKRHFSQIFEISPWWMSLAPLCPLKWMPSSSSFQRSPKVYCLVKTVPFWMAWCFACACELQCPSLFTQSSRPAVHTPHPTRSLQPFSAGVTPGVKQATDRGGCGLSGWEGAVVWIIYKLLCSKSALMKQFFGWSS